MKEQKKLTGGKIVRIHNLNTLRVIPTKRLNTYMETEKFIPTGAMAFFVLLIVLCAIIWFSIYFLMLSRN